MTGGGINAVSRRRSGARVWPFVALVTLLFSAPAQAQQGSRTSSEIETDPVVIDPQVGRTAPSQAGQVGQRQTRASTETTIGSTPMARISNRVPNRVQSRIRNRIDRDYDPRANATSPFVVAGERVRAATRPRSR